MKCDVFHFLLPAGSAAGSSAGIVFTHGPILGFFAPQARHVAPIKVKFGMKERSSMPNFTLIGPGVGVYGPQNWEKMEFYQYNCPYGAFPSHNFYKIYKFYARLQST